MRKFQIHGEDILLTSSRRVDDAGFAKAYEFISRFDREILMMEKSTVIILHDNERNSIVIERMNTDTFTLHVQYEINGHNVFQIN